MRWRYLILGLTLAVPIAGVVQIWPASPLYRIPGGDERTFLADDLAEHELMFLMFDPKSGDAPVIERRAARSGRLTSSTPLDWEKLAGRNLTRDYGTLVSADRRTIVRVFLIDVGLDVAHFCAAAFDTITGKVLGDIIVCDMNGFWLSPDGHWFLMALQAPSCRLVILDTRSGLIHCEIPAPAGLSAALHGRFSPDSRKVLFQWSYAGEDGDETRRTLNLLDIQSRTVERKFILPVRDINQLSQIDLDEWRPGEVRISETTYPRALSYQEKCYRHSFDGVTLGEGQFDELLSNDYLSFSGSLACCGEGDTWVAHRFVDWGAANYEPDWRASWRRLEALIGVSILDKLNLPQYHGWVRIIDRRTREVVFHQDVATGYDCHVVLNGEFFISAGDDESPGIEVWPIHPTPRWIWSAATFLGVTAAFSFVGRWRFVTLRSRANS